VFHDLALRAPTIVVQFLAQVFQTINRMIDFAL
jgi:hypothetical protein